MLSEIFTEPGVVAQVFNPSYSGSRHGFKTSLEEEKFSQPMKSWAWWQAPVILAMWKI
jgi:hypothetical protein